MTSAQLRVLAGCRARDTCIEVMQSVCHNATRQKRLCGEVAYTFQVGETCPGCDMRQSRKYA